MTANADISMIPNGASSRTSARRLAVWLFVMCALVAAMVIVGGATRLTDSGLSITEWRPVTGAIPPLSQGDWLTEFEKYKQIPEYEEVNFGMSLEAFKVIYWWEWGHRFLGRLLGIAFFVPLLVFVSTGQARGTLALKLFGLFLLGGMQGALGWWMVSSGLADRVDVSQYRLAAHLSLAVLLFALMFWLGLSLLSLKTVSISTSLRRYSYGLLGLVFVQIVLGAFVAGLRAGRTFNTWPLMDGKFFPDGYFLGAAGMNDLFETVAAVQFNHRIGAYVVAGAVLVFWFAARKTAIATRASLTLAIVGFQIVLGIWTLLAATPISLGLMHQAGALILMCSVLYTAHGMRR